MEGVRSPGEIFTKIRYPPNKIRIFSATTYVLNVL
jgi:hypothetical protein